VFRRELVRQRHGDRDRPAQTEAGDEAIDEHLMERGGPPGGVGNHAEQHRAENDRGLTAPAIADVAEHDRPD
jgi:hypothetical protein